MHRELPAPQIAQRLIIAAFLLLGTNLAAHAQSAAHAVRSAVPPSSRFEIVQNELLARLTFRLDKATGRAWVLVTTKQGDSAWEPVPKTGQTTDQPSSTPDYQIFMSGLSAKWTFLLEVNSGATWQLVTDSSGALAWQGM